MNQLRFTSLISTVADPFCMALAPYLQERCAMNVSFDAGHTFEAREPLVDEQQVDLVWLCGLLYLHKRSASQQLTPAFAPSMFDERSHEQPVYYSDMIVRNDSPYHTFTDLQGSVWAYNEAVSFSGYQIVRAHLVQKGYHTPYFRAMVKSGAHLNSLRFVRDGQADCAAIDSTVIQMLRKQHSDRLVGLRTITRLGPYPMPLWAFTERCPTEIRAVVTACLLQMHQEQRGQKLLHEWAIDRFHPVTAEEYTPIAAANQLAQQVP